MNNGFKAVKITDKVYWVGGIDWGVRDFHGYQTNRGTTYNAYLVLAEKVALIDTVKASHFGEMVARIASVIEPSKIDVIVSNHSELDHTGCLMETIQAVRPTAVYASTMGAKTLDDHFHSNGIVQAVADGQKLSLGDMDLVFIETRLCHWPDSMVSYLPQEQILFSQDVFGMHLACSQRFDDQVDDCLLAEESAKYYANILLPLSNFVTRALEKLAGMKLPLKLVAPDHGPIWRRGIDGIIADYARWARQERTSKAIVVYDTMWQSTALMARVIADGLSSGGCPVRVMPMGSCRRSDVATELLDAGAMVAGAPTINNTMFPTMADVLTYARGLKPRGLVGGAFGSYGWSGESIRDIAAVLGEMNVELVGQPLKVRYVPDAAALDACRKLGADIAAKLAAKRV